MPDINFQSGGGFPGSGANISTSGGPAGGGDYGMLMNMATKRAQEEGDRRRKMFESDMEMRNRSMRGGLDRGAEAGPMKWEPWQLQQAALTQERKTPGFNPESIRDFERSMAMRKTFGMLPENALFGQPGAGASMESMQPKESWEEAQARRQGADRWRITSEHAGDLGRG